MIMIDCTMDCIAVGRTEFPGPGTYMYFGYQVTVTDKYKLGPKYSQRYNGVKSKFSTNNFKKIRIPQFSETRFGSFVGLFSCFYVYKQ